MQQEIIRPSSIIFKQGNYYARILADSIAAMPGPYSAKGSSRLVTMECCFPRFLLAEANTHRDKSRNSASSRAIPVEKRAEQVDTDPFVPIAFTKNKSGMQATETLEGVEGAQAAAIWRRIARQSAQAARDLAEIKTHKQHANRVCETYAWHTVVFSGTRWTNMFNLRTDKDAQPEMQIIAMLMKSAFEASRPRELYEGEWHLPYVWPEDAQLIAEIGEDGAAKLSIVRSAAVSFERQYAERTASQVLARFNDMMKLGHWSPFEHAAKVASRKEIDRYALFRRIEEDFDGIDTVVRFTPESIGNFDVPWLQWRKTQPNEAIWTPPKGD